jgi:hypothetical protein
MSSSSPNGPTQVVGGAGGPRNDETWRDLAKVTAQMQTCSWSVNRVASRTGSTFEPRW